MTLTKDKVCVYIENEAQLKEARELLEKYGEEITEDGTFELTDDNKNYLNIFVDGVWFLCDKHSYLNQITLSELETILKNEAK